MNKEIAEIARRIFAQRNKQDGREYSHRIIYKPPIPVEAYK